MTRNSIVSGLALALLVGALHVTVWQVFNAPLEGDELRYVGQARLIAAGESPYPDGLVKNTPLFPVMLAGLISAGVDESRLNLVSIVSIVLASLLLFAMLCRFCSTTWAFGLSALFAFYPPLVQIGSQVMTEPLAVLLFLKLCFLLHDIDDVRAVSVWRWVGVVIVLAALALLKPLFGYALAAGLVLSLLVVALAPSARAFFLGTAGSCLVAILLCSPFLSYIHSLTGSYFSWGTTGGEHLYWMSIGGEDIWGSWVPPEKVRDYAFLVENGYAEEIEQASALDGPASQTYLGELASSRIQGNPGDFALNVAANAGRTLFNYPYSFRPQSLFTYAYILPNMLLYLVTAFGILLLPATWRRQPAGLASVLTFGLIYLGGNILVGSTARQGLALLGPLLLWLAFQVHLLMRSGVINPGALSALGSDLYAATGRRRR